VLWQEQPEYFGPYTDIRVPNLNGGNGFADDEVWLVDNSTAACTGNPFRQCWVEAGIFRQSGGAQIYFWADSRPMNSNTFNLHLLGGTDGAGTNDHFMIIKDARGGPGIFQLWIYNDSLSTLYNGTSTSNTMRGKRIIIGQEVAGTSGASATNANFTRNIWAVQTLGPEYVFWTTARSTMDRSSATVRRSAPGPFIPPRLRPPKADSSRPTAALDAERRMPCDALHPHPSRRSCCCCC
jgi:hypothetical protein